MECLLCNSSEVHVVPNSIQFYTCHHCKSTFRDPKFFVSTAAEKLRYEKHNNDVEDEGYQSFVSPIVNAITQDFSNEQKGLDFGAGTGPVIAKLLEDRGFDISLYDPFFHPKEDVLKKKYDFIICCEVIEHFHNPLKEFELLQSMLKANGTLYCMTDMLPKPEKFANWYYKDDPTHVIFYSEENLIWIKERVGFRELNIDGRLLVFHA